MPDKPLWFDRLQEAIRQLEHATETWVDRATLETLLGVGRRRAQQLLAPLARRRVGTSIVARRGEVIAYLQRIRAGEKAQEEDRRREHLWTQLSQAREEWIQHPPVLVEVPHAQIRKVAVQDFEGLPEGVELAPGVITVRFVDPDQALRKLMALAIAISQNRQGFDERVSLPSA